MPKNAILLIVGLHPSRAEYIRTEWRIKTLLIDARMLDYGSPWLDYGNPSVDYGSPSVNYVGCNQILLMPIIAKRASEYGVLSTRFFVVDAIFALQAMLIRLVDDVFSAYMRCFFHSKACYSLLISLSLVLKFWSKVPEIQLNFSCLFFVVQLQTDRAVPNPHRNYRRDGKRVKRKPLTVFAHEDS